MLWLVALPSLVALALVVGNALSWPRGRVTGGRDVVPARVSVLVPARNEANNIEACVRAAWAERPHEILVLDDGSTDDTGAILERLTHEIPALRVLHGQALPSGWVGKVHACHQLALAANGDSLLFVDADVRLHAGALARLASVARELGADVVTAVPRQETGTWLEHLVVPLLHLTYTAWLPLPLVWRSRDPRLLAANGQVLFVQRGAYDEVGGFARVAGALVDDMAFCRAAKEAGVRVAFIDGHEIATCRMYRSARAVIEGFSKNLHAGVGSTVAVLCVVALYLWAFVVPFVALVVVGPAVPVLVAVGANVAMRALLCVRHAQSVVGALLHPLGVLALVVIALNSTRWALLGRVRWSGRVYGVTGSSTRPS
jgi:chlorobactene glucosyltransferase